MMISARISVNRRNDSLFEAALQEITPLPVFIIGLHRSGTTFLYQTLTDVFPITSLTVYHVLNYDRILLYNQEKTDFLVRKELDEMFRSWNMDTRLIDNIALSHAMPEEYGWLLRSRAGSFHTNARTAPLLDKICRKLQFTTPSAAAVLQKNPFDTGYVHELLRYFPDARFIFLQRDPVAIVNSQFRVAMYFGENKNLFINLLFKDIPLGRAWMWLQRAMRKAAGEFLYGRIALCYILNDVTKELGRLDKSWNSVLPRQRMSLHYSELVSDLDGALKKVSTFLRLAPRNDYVHERPNPSDPTLFPEVAAAEASFCRRLKDKGIAQRLFSES
ncbi:MAG: sulfotransferase [Candidatus Aminicenantes bacterium]|nr:sulfotransferase [Candidatus Aminicenantes bacterium]